MIIMAFLKFLLLMIALSSVLTFDLTESKKKNKKIDEALSILEECPLIEGLHDMECEKRVKKEKEKSNKKNVDGVKKKNSTKDQEKCPLVEGVPDIECLERLKKEKEKAAKSKHDQEIVDRRKASNNLKRLSPVSEKLEQFLSGGRGYKTNKKRKRGKGASSRSDKTKNVRPTKERGKNRGGARGKNVKKRRKPRRRGFKFPTSKRFIRRLQRRQKKRKSEEVENLETKILELDSLGDKKMVKSLLSECSSLLRKIKKQRRERKNKNKEEGTELSKNTTQVSTSFEVLGTINILGMSVAEDLGWGQGGKPQTMVVEADDLALEVSNVKTEKFEQVTFPSKKLGKSVNDSITFPEKLFSTTQGDNGTIISSFYEAFGEMQFAARNTSNNSSFINSDVVSAEVIPKPRGTLSQPVKVTFKHKRVTDQHVPSCVFWDYNMTETAEGGWGSKGCSVHHSNATHTECHCTHLTDFAVLFRVDNAHRAELSSHGRALTIISIVGCVISILALVLTIATLLCLSKLLRSERNIIHLNLAVALLVANLIFVFAEHATGKRVPCFIVTLALFYFFLCAFAWMLVEGIQIWILLTQVFQGRPLLLFYHLFGWGAPLVVVTISAGIYRYNITGKRFCWLSTSSSAIWTFIAPAIVIITINVIVLVKALYLTYKHNQDKEGTTGTRKAARCCLVLMPILGFTWIFGIFSINGKLLVFQYLFTIFNSIQGLFIFIFYILLNVEVQREYYAIRRKQRDTQSAQQRLTHSTTAASSSESRNGAQKRDVELLSASQKA